jgi:tetratricopeptide (TPR) repeat protein
METVKVFVSSRMRELRDERLWVAEVLRGIEYADLGLRPFLYEDDAVANEGRPREEYLGEVETSELYIGILGTGYGKYTVEEYYHAKKNNIDRLVFIKNIASGELRETELENFIRELEDVTTGIVVNYYDANDFKQRVRKAVLAWIERFRLGPPGDNEAILLQNSDDVTQLYEAGEPLYGRDSLCQDIELDLRQQSSRVSIRGFGGTGKTALAIQISKQFLEQKNSKVLWLRVGRDNALMCVGKLLSALNIEPLPDLLSLTQDEKQKFLSESLTTKNIELVVLDGLWNPEILRLIEKTIRLLVTTRIRFSDLKEFNLTEHSLPREASLQILYFHSLGKPSITDMNNLGKFRNNKAAHELCGLLGDNPFALRLAGRWLYEKESTPSDLIDIFTDSITDSAIFDSEFDNNEPGKPRNIVELIKTSVLRVPANARQVLFSLSSFYASTVTFDLLVEYLALTSFNAGANTSKLRALIKVALSELKNAGLVSQLEKEGIPIYQLHELTRQYCRIFDQELTQDHSGNRIQAIKNFVVNRANQPHYITNEIMNILGESKNTKESSSDNAILTILENLALSENAYFAARGYSIDALGLLDDGIRIAKKLNRKDLAEKLLTKVGNHYADMALAVKLPESYLFRALEAYKEAYQLVTEIRDISRQAIVLGCIGMTHLRRALIGAKLETPDLIATYLNEAHELAQASGDLKAQIKILEWRAHYARWQAEKSEDEALKRLHYEEARGLLAESGRFSKEIKNLEGQYFALLNQGEAERYLNNIKEALNLHRQAADLVGPSFPDWYASALEAIGQDFYAMRDRESAYRYLTQALNIYAEHNALGSLANLVRWMQKYSFPIEDQYQAMLKGE